jgi:pimeloyl-ACP methyl ester carboxylesterase
VLAVSGIIEPPILFGHSDGGSIALLFAAAYPEQARAVISEAAHVFIEEICLAGIRRAGDAYAQGAWRAGLHRHHGDSVDLIFRGWHDTWLRPLSPSLEY